MVIDVCFRTLSQVNLSIIYVINIFYVTHWAKALWYIIAINQSDILILAFEHLYSLWQFDQRFLWNVMNTCTIFDLISKRLPFLFSAHCSYLEGHLPPLPLRQKLLWLHWCKFISIMKYHYCDENALLW